MGFGSRGRFCVWVIVGAEIGAKEMKERRKPENPFVVM
jgi:hypothetical protein